MLKKWTNAQKWIAVSILAWASTNAFPVFAVEADTTTQKNDILNVEMPIIEEGGKSPFDFILDPQGLLCQTGAERYGGGSVEEGATVLFCNKEGQYDFSKTSDWLTVTNKGVEPVTVTVSVSITGLSEISMREDKAFAEGGRSFYLAIVDSQGNEEPISAEGETSVSFDMDAVGEDGGFVEYSFGLTGCCNPNADWKGISDRPVIKITWSVESRYSEEKNQIPEDKPEEPEAKSETIPEASSTTEEMAPGQEEAVGEVPEESNQEDSEPEPETVAEPSAAEPESTEKPQEATKENSENEEANPEETEPKPEAETESDSVAEETEMQ